MLRQTLARSALRSSRPCAKATQKTFATSARRQAEVQLTIGMAHDLKESWVWEGMANECYRWKAGLN